MTLGMTNGTSYGGLTTFVGNTGIRVTNPYGSSYGISVSSNTGSNNAIAGSIGVTTDSTKSGIVADYSALPYFSPRFLIRY